MTGHIYQLVLANCQTGRPCDGKLRMLKVSKALHLKPLGRTRELRALGHSGWLRQAGILAYFDTGAFVGPAEVINGKPDHLPDIWALNQDNYILCSLIHSRLREASNALEIRSRHLSFFTTVRRKPSTGGRAAPGRWKEPHRRDRS